MVRSLILLIGIAASIRGEQRLAGTVTDQATGEPLGYVTVRAVCDPDTLEDMTDLAGNFSISRPGSSAITAPDIYSSHYYADKYPLPEGIVFTVDGRILRDAETADLATGMYFRTEPGYEGVQKILRICGTAPTGSRRYRSQAKSSASDTVTLLCGRPGYTTVTLGAAWGDTALAIPLTIKAVPASPVLVPGTGFTDTITPGPAAASVGDPQARGYNAAAIAQWDVVPEQAFTGTFGIGVVAFHIYGMDFVEFSVEGGVPETVTAMTFNPRTGVEEYRVNLDASDFTDGWIEVRAKAYPVNGRPYQLEPLELFADQGGTANFPVLELDAGTHVAQDLMSRVTVPYRGWQTIRPKSGIKPEECILTGGSRFWKGHVKIEGVTWLPGTGGNMLYGSSTGVNWAWLHNVTIIGNGRENTTWWTTNNWARSFITRCDISRVQNVFNGSAGRLLVRNVHIHDIYEDTFRTYGLVTNVTIEGVDRGDTEYHPALFSLGPDTQKHYNFILYNVTANSGIKAAGISGDNTESMAMVNVTVNCSGYKSMYMGGALKNILFQDTDLIGGGGFKAEIKDTPEIIEDVVFRDSRHGWQEPYLPDTYQVPGITIWRDGTLVE